MADRDSVDTDSAVVTTYVPAYQKAEWESHADDLGMSQSEFVRSMVQAGRRGFGTVIEGDDADVEVRVPHTGRHNPSNNHVEKGVSTGSNPGGELSETLLQTLEENGPLSWNELVDDVVGDIEDRLNDAIYELQTENKITHSPRAGKYVLVGE